MSNIKEQIKELPDTPGVYFFKDGERLLYIGKATSLHDRVRSYFNDDLAQTRSPLIQKMVAEATSVDYQETGSVLEALILERNLIGKKQPPYNTKEKDNKSANFVIFTNETFPQIRIVRERELQTSIDPDEIEESFGPYPSRRQLESALKIIRKIFPYRDRKCTPVKEKGNKKPCFSYQIGLCPGVCTSEITKKAYADTISNLSLFLEGETDKLRDKLKADMHAAAEAEQFERAQKIKGQIFSLDHIDDVALIEEDTVSADSADLRLEGYDIAHLAADDMVGALVVLEDGYARKEDYRKFNIKGVSGANDPAALAEVVRRRLGHPEWPYPDVFVIDGGKAQRNAVKAELAAAEVDIPVVSVVKDDKHKPKAILGPKSIIHEHGKEIKIVNSESHRFAQSFHKQKRRKRFLE
ncbi:MAG: UvrB/UvrC motif-containing protein [Candidatus Paceibacterota bacterium]